jgi:hypothetical protein
MDQTVPGLRFDAEGVCHLCHVQDRLQRAHFIEQDREKEADFRLLIERIRAAGKGKPFDCVVPLSGGGDSSYTLYMACKLGLRPVAWHFDNGWVSDVARANMRKVTERLGVPLKTLAFPWERLRGAYVAALRASVPEVCLPCLVAVWSLAYRAAAEEGVRYVIHGSSPMTEGIFPTSWSYVDGRYLESVVRTHGDPSALAVARDFNRLRFSSLLRDLALRRTRVIMLPLYLDWEDRRIKQELQREFDWGDGGKHADCLYTPFRNWIIHAKFGYDLRRTGPAALVRSGRISRAQAMAYFADHPVQEDPAATAMVLERLGLTRADLDAIVASPPRHFEDFKTYHPTMRRLEPLVRAAVRLGILSQMVYDKYFEC